jgi:hypothetical protein
MGDPTRAVEHDEGQGSYKRLRESMTAPHAYFAEAPFCPGGSADTSNGVVGGVSNSWNSRYWADKSR